MLRGHIRALEIPRSGSFVGRLAAAVAVVGYVGHNYHAADYDYDDRVANYVTGDGCESEATVSVKDEISL